MGESRISLDQLLSEARQHLRDNEPAEVVTACEAARAVAPDDLRFVFMQGIALRRTGDLGKAEPLLKKMVEAAPQLAAAQQEYGLLCLSQHRLGEARRLFERAVELDPKLQTAWHTLRDIRAAEGDDAGAADAYRRALGSSKPAQPIQKALELVNAGRLGIAEGICRAFLKQNPLDVNAIRLLAEIGLKLGATQDSINLLERCLELAPDFHVARSNYAAALAKRQRFNEALEQMGRLETDQPDNLAHQVQCASLYSMAGRFAEAHEKFRNVLKLVPNSATILTNYGHSLRYGGKGDEAIGAYLGAIEADPRAGEAYWSLANLKTFRFSEEQIMDLQQRLAALTQDGPDKYHLAFALGKALEDEARFEESFAAYATGNAVKQRGSAYAAEFTAKRVHNAVSQCDASLFDEDGHPSDEPIFIVGLPRAGSTLLEQILASHSQVEATAELPFIGQIAGELTGRIKDIDESPYPGLLKGLDAAKRQELGQHYLDRAAVYRHSAPRFIDKLPNNFLHIALIKCILPNATIIDARREPMAACFANFKQLFARGQEFTYSLENLGHYYADYLRLMGHWDVILPGQVLTVRYEEVVADLESQVRRLLAFCKLPFESSCVNFHEQDRAVRTASSEQVRQPIYKDALALWQRYDSHLGPLREVLVERGVVQP